MTYFISTFLSVIVLGVLTFIGLTAGLGSPDGGRNVRIACAVGGVAWSIICVSVGGASALVGVIIAAILVFVGFFLRNRFR
ncbi:MAG: hypothetical protein K8F91_18555 [Candidatus Obscuribacterales bacterium]|nr:hypothetical protein [Candidatus Obscuribacterales bacterium]